MSLETLLAVWSIALVLALMTIAVIVRPLLLILTEVCGGRDRARFWTVYARVLPPAAPLLTVSRPGLLDTVVAAGTTATVLQRTVLYALAGIIVALMIMGSTFWRPIALMLQELIIASRQDNVS